MIRHIWILVYGTSNLWTSWIKAYLLKGTNLWEVKASHIYSWNMRKLLLLRPFAHLLIQHIIGNGPIRSKWSSRVIYDSGLSINAKVNAIVLDDNWRWPAIMSIDLVEIRSPASAMESLRTPHPLVSCYKIVWFQQNIPRMGFILWLAIKGRLSTLDRVQRYDPQVVTTCVLCNSQAETHAHLFFECFYSKAI
ncbi:hypothetical protein Ddye_016650 [Dipteronia dyeriana]|uniref:Reverse transcriptase zinc-binding domain-containing protein n=1 Tax=Dipteronia dyeriana TaxID=168575 RepID=A0AAD9U7S6_9ROSI|nr:hypothetical protein Ddye_016650 [Dipteronia dyeriana]